MTFLKKLALFGLTAALLFAAVACGEGAVRLSEVQPAGGKRMADTAFASGGKLQEGDCFDKPVL